MSKSARLVALAVPLVWITGTAASAALGPWIALGMASALLLVGVAVTDGPRTQLLVRPTARLVAIGAAAAALMIAATYALSPLLVRFVPHIAFLSQEVYAKFVSPLSLPAVIAGAVPLILAEEILWRGTFQNLAGAKHGIAVVLCSAVYALAQAPLGSPLLVAVAFVCGCYWAALRAYFGSLIPPLVAHLGWDLSVILVPPRFS